MQNYCRPTFKSGTLFQWPEIWIEIKCVGKQNNTLRLIESNNRFIKRVRIPNGICVKKRKKEKRKLPVINTWREKNNEA